MTFDELPLYFAVADVYEDVIDPRSDSWLLEESKSMELCKRIMERMPIYHRERLLQAFTQYGKSGTVGGDMKKLQLTVAVALAHGAGCFWANRGKGSCSEDVTLDRLQAGGPYSVANCVIACGRHNSQRNCRSVEAFLKESNP